MWEWQRDVSGVCGVRGKLSYEPGMQQCVVEQLMLTKCSLMANSNFADCSIHS